MRTNEERIGLVRKRTAELKQKKQQKKRRVLNAVCVAACMIFIVGIGALMPTLMSGVAEGGVIHTLGVASLIAENAALGYILMGLLAFFLGVCVTVLLYRLRRRNERRHKEAGDDEL